MELKKELNSVEKQTSAIIFPGSPCAFRRVMGLLSMIQDAGLILVGPDVCLYNFQLSRGRKHNQGGSERPVIELVKISSSDIVFGIADQMEKKIMDMAENSGVRGIFVISTCVQKITGEDIESVIQSFKDKVAVPVINIETDNFKCMNADMGIREAMRALTQIMKVQNNKKKDKAVNILGMDKRDDMHEIIPVLAENGIKVNLNFPSRVSMQELINAPETDLNLIVSEYFIPLAEEMALLFGTKWVYMESDFSWRALKDKYFELGEILNIDLKQFVEKVTERSKHGWERMKNQLQNKTCILDLSKGASNSLLGLLKLLNSTALDIRLIILSSENKELQASFNAESGEFRDNPIIITDNMLEVKSEIMRLKPDYYIGSGLGGFRLEGLRNIDLKQIRRHKGSELFNALSDDICKTPEDEGNGFISNYINEWGRRA